MSDAVFEDIRARVAHHAEVPLESVTLESRLLELGIDGDDAGGLLEEIVQVHGLNLDGFCWHLYFGEEGLNPVFWWVLNIRKALSARFRHRWSAACDAERDIGVGHLVEVVREKRWRHPAGPSPVRGPDPVFETAFAMFALLPAIFAILGPVALVSGLTDGALDLAKLGGVTAMVGLSAIICVGGWLSAERVIRDKIAGAEALAA